MGTRTAIFVSLLALLALSPVCGAYVGENNELAVFITYPDQSYDVGSDVIVTVTVFARAQYYDPRELVMVVGEDERDLGLTREAEGRYKGVVSIQLADLDRDGRLKLYVGASTGGLFAHQAFDIQYVDTLVGSSFVVRLSVPDSTDVRPSPGEDVEFVVGISFRGAPVDPDAGTLKVSYSDPAGISTDVAMTRIGTGQFQGRLTVPAALKESTPYTLSVEASYTKDSRTYEGSAESEVHVSFMDVWAHVVSVTPAQARLEVHVLGTDGNPLPGASVSLDYIFSDDAWEERTSSLSGTTDANGTAVFTLVYTDLGMDASFVSIEGRVRSGALTEVFGGYLMAREQQPWDWGTTGVGFEASVVTPGSFVPGASVTVESELKYDGAPMPSEDVVFYLTDAHNIYRFGTDTTDSEGRFDFPLNVPTLGTDEHVRVLNLDYQVQAGTRWEYSSDTIQVGEYLQSRLLDDLVDPQATMTVGPFSVGENVTVTVDHPSADGIDENAFIIWSIGNSTDWSAIDNLPWQLWNIRTISILQVVPCTWSEGRYTATFRCPSFLNLTSRLYMYGLIGFTDQGELLVAAKAAKKEGLSPLPPNPAPTAAITAPVASQRYGGTLKVKGTAADDAGVSKVELRLDGGAWMTVTGTTAWSYELDTKPLAAGNHTLEVRSYDGQKYSSVATLAFVVDQSVVKEEDDDGPGFGAAAGALAILAAVAAATAAGRRRRGS